MILCRRQGRLLAFSLFYRWRDSLYGRLAGFDYAATASTDAYFNLAFYIPLPLALDEKLRQIKVGMASWKAKVMRGATLDPGLSPKPSSRGRATARPNGGPRSFRAGWTGAGLALA